MKYRDIILEKQNGIAILTFNRPEKMNSFNTNIVSREFPHAIRSVATDDKTKVLILTGAGERAFCAGSDVEDRLGKRLKKQRVDKKRWETIEPVGRIGLTLYGFHKPVIAAINGVTAGSGLALAKLCDIRIAAENARFTYAFVKRGLIPDCGSTFLLPKLVGSAKALELMWTGAMIDANEACQIGLVNRVVPFEKLMDEALSFANELARGPSVAIELIKWAVSKSYSNSFESHLDFESRAQQICMESDDFREGIAAFREKRQPNFRGR